MKIEEFQKIIWAYYAKNKRDLPWRKTRDPYRIFVSEVMLQQTQADRVIPKYVSFIKRFPTVKALAGAKLADVLGEWQGLGYNRRALFLKRAAEKVEHDLKGKFPKDFKALVSLPGVGLTTAGDIMIFAWDMPVAVIETNVRSVFIHFFFPGKKKITDKAIIPLVEKMMETKKIRQNPRDWYYALFDYGVYLKRTYNPSRQSAHHAGQSRFEGSYRQKRALILRVILEKPRKSLTIREIQELAGYTGVVTRKILSDLEKEGFIKKRKSGLYGVV